MSILRPLTRPLLLLALLVPLLLGVAASCSPVRHIMMTASPGGNGPLASPALPDPALGLDAWQAARPDIEALLTRTLYGAEPPAATVRVLSRQIIDEAAYNGAAVLELVELELDLVNGATAQLTLGLALPTLANQPAPVILIPGECGLPTQMRRDDLPAPRGPRAGYCDPGDSFISNFIGGFFGDYVVSPPAEQILRRGYAIIAWHESDIAPDRASLHADSLRALGLDPDAQDRPGAISVWAWMMSRVADYVVTDDRFDPSKLVVMGHSRRAKAALLAAARDERIGTVLSHQSGTGGASLHRDHVGEPIASITESYPHWFVPAYADYAEREDALPLDAHHLLAMIAPRNVLLGNARRDVWSDPAGAWRAAQAASPIWSLYGVDGLTQTRLDQMAPSGAIAFHIRPATHGVRDVDWEAFLTFLEARVPPTASAPVTGTPAD